MSTTATPTTATTTQTTQTATDDDVDDDDDEDEDDYVDGHDADDDYNNSNDANGGADDGPARARAGAGAGVSRARYIPLPRSVRGMPTGKKDMPSSLCRCRSIATICDWRRCSGAIRVCAIGFRRVCAMPPGCSLSSARSRLPQPLMSSSSSCVPLSNIHQHTSFN